MPRKKSPKEVPLEKLRWSLDTASLPFKTTKSLNPLTEVIGQKRGIEALRFGTEMSQKGYNIFVTGMSGTGRMSTVKKILEEISNNNGQVPDDLCYVNNFKKPDAPVLLTLKAGVGRKIKKDIHDLIETLKREAPRLFESQDYINRKKEILESYENKGKGFFKELDKKVRDEGFTLLDVQVGQVKRPEVVPLVDGEPVHIDQLEIMVEKDRFPKKEFDKMKKKQAVLSGEIGQIFLELREMQKEVQRNTEEMDRLMFNKMAEDLAEPLVRKYRGGKIRKYFQDMLDDMGENLQIFSSQPQETLPGFPVPASHPMDAFQPYQVNLLVDNGDQKGPPVIIESHPTYKNLFGSIERVVDRSGIWRTDFSKITAGSLVKANGGYLVVNLMEAAVEPGVWPALKRALKTEKMEIETYDPFYLFTTTGMKPEPIDMDSKVVIISNSHLYHMVMAYDEDIPKIFKVRSDFDSSMNNDEESVLRFAEFIKAKTEEDDLKPFDRTGVGALVEHAVRMTGRQEKISTSFSSLTDLIHEAAYWAGKENSASVKGKHVDRAIESRIFRSNMIEEKIQEMIDRGTLLIDVDGEVAGQVNGLAVYSMGDHMFGKPSRITVSTSMGRAGIINIEREADMSGSTHNKGVLILSGYLRKKYAQDKPLTMSASIAFEQSYAGVDGDSASSTEIYALLSSLSGVPLKQYIAVTGSVNQNGEIQPIGGVNEKIEGFYDCCVKSGLTGNQGVMIPDANVKDLMLRKDVIQAVKRRKFRIYSVKTVDEGIEILAGMKSGEIKADGTYPKGTINYLVNEKLYQLAEGLKKFGGNNKKEEEKIPKEK